MNPFSEVKELNINQKNDVGNKLNAFEKAANDVNEVRHIKTIREDLEGTNYPGTNVRYKLHTFKLDGEKVEGVFPVFDSKFDTCLSKKLREASDEEQFNACTKRLQSRIEQD
ncbi:MAG: HNH endonuclease, partial [Clostridiales bacterium]|nr:HNH endonuclease [Clostridiales bacterium]